MPAWNEARRASQSARIGVQSNRAAPGASVSALPQAAERFAQELCYHCGEKGVGRRVGLLAITGKVIYCKAHAKYYKADKDWEATHKKEMGLCA